MSVELNVAVSLVIDYFFYFVFKDFFMQKKKKEKKKEEAYSFISVNRPVSLTITSSPVGNQL